MIAHPGWYCFCLLDGRLVGSEHPENLHFDPIEKEAISRRISRSLVDSLNVGAVINLTRTPWSYGVENLTAHHVSMDDRSIAETEDEVLLRIIEIIDSTIAQGFSVWVHCQHGIDRTGCVIGCYLVSRGMAADLAIDQIKSQWPDRRRSKQMYDELWQPVADRIRRFEARREGSNQPP